MFDVVLECGTGVLLYDTCHLGLSDFCWGTFSDCNTFEPDISTDWMITSVICERAMGSNVSFRLSCAE